MLLLLCSGPLPEWKPKATSLLLQPQMISLIAGEGTDGYAEWDGTDLKVDQDGNAAMAVRLA